MSKVIERAAASQINATSPPTDCSRRHQSAYGQKNLTETAALRVSTDLLMSDDARKVTLASLLHLRAAFDCVDHAILLQRLEVVFPAAEIHLF